MRARVAAVLLCISVIFPHFRVMEVGGYEVTLGLVASVLFLATVVRSIPPVLCSLVLCFLVAITGLSALASQQAQSSDFFQTFALLLLSSTIVLAGLVGNVRMEIVRSVEISRSLLLSLTLISLLSVAQVATGMLGSDLLFNPFGGNQYFHTYDPMIGLVEVPRAHSFYLEPSYSAFMIGSLTVIILCLSGIRVFVVLLAAAGLLATQSVTGLLVMAVLLVLLAIRARPAVLIILGVLFGIGWALIGPYMLTRLASINDVGTSANYRLVAPLQVVQDVLSSGALGKPLGSIEQVVGAYGLQMAGVQATSLDNGYYVAIYYFGWFGLIGLAAMVAWAISNAIRAPRGSTYWVIPVWLLGSLGFSGGIVAPEFAFMCCLALIAYRVAREDENGASTVSGRRNVQRSSRVGAHA